MEDDPYYLSRGGGGVYQIPAESVRSNLVQKRGGLQTKESSMSEARKAAERIIQRLEI